jgi:hypothetical protein
MLQILYRYVALALFLFLLSCSNSLPKVISLGLKLSSFSFQIPADQKIQVTDYSSSLIFEGTCTKNTENLEFSSDGTSFANLNPETIELQNNCKTNGTFIYTIKDLHALLKLFKIDAKTAPKNIDFYVRGYSASANTDINKFSLVNALSDFPKIAGTSLNVNTTLASDLGLMSGYINPDFGVSLSWDKNQTAASTLVIEVSQNNGLLWLPILKTENSGKLSINSELAKNYFTSSTLVRIAETSGGTQIISNSPVISILKTRPMVPLQMIMQNPTTQLSNKDSITLQANGSTADSTSAVFLDNICSKLAGFTYTTETNTSILINNINTDGTYNYYVQQIDRAGNRSDCSKNPLKYTRDTIKPIVTGLTSDSTPLEIKTWNWACSDDHAPCSFRYLILTATSANPFTIANAYSSLITASQSSGVGKYHLFVQAQDSAGNESEIVEVTAEINSDTPGISISNPSVADVRSTIFYYFDVIYSNASTISLNSSAISFINTGTVSNCAVHSITSVASNTKRVTIKNCTGDGLVKLEIAANSALSPAGLQAPAAASVAAANVDNTAPGILISNPSKAHANGLANIFYTITYSGESAITLQASDITLNGASSACAKNLNNDIDPHKKIVSISGCNGNGSLNISIAANTAYDNAGNSTAASGASASVNIDNTDPSVTVGSANLAQGNASATFSFPVSFIGATSFTFDSTKVGFSGAATGGCSVQSINNPLTANPTVNISGCNQNGNLSIFIKDNSAQDSAGNANLASANSPVVSIDNTKPLVAIDAAAESPAVDANLITEANAFTNAYYKITFTGGNSFDLKTTNVEFGGTASEGCSANVTNGNTANPVVRVFGCSGNGTMNFRISANVATDLSNNKNELSASSSPISIDNIKPTVAIASLGTVYANQNKTTTFSVTYSNATDYIALTNGAILLSGATLGCIVGVANGTTDTPSVNISNCSGNGDLTFSIASNTSADAAGNLNDASLASSIVKIDNTNPTLTGLSNDANSVTSKTWTWSCSDSNIPCTYRYIISAASLSSPFIGANTFDSATTQTQNGGNGTYYFYVQGKDAAENLSAITQVTAQLNSANPGVTFNNPSIGNINSSGTFYIDVSYSNSQSITLNSTDVSFNYSALANSCVVHSITDPAPTSNTRRIRIKNCQGDGTVNISLAANTAQSPSSVQALAAGPSAAVSIDNTAPSISMGNPDSHLVNSSSTITYVISYSADAITALNISQASFQYTGNASGCIVSNIANPNSQFPNVLVSNCSGDGTMQFKIKSGSAQDNVGNFSSASLWSTAVTIDNTNPAIAFGTPTISTGSVKANSSASIDFPVNYTDANLINLTPSDVNLGGTATLGCTVSVIDGTTPNAKVRVANCTSNGGTLFINLLSDTAGDNAGNLANSTGPSSLVNIDNLAPTITIGNPSPSSGKSSTSIAYTITYSENSNIILDLSKISFSGTGVTCANPSISGAGNIARTVTFTNCNGNGNLNFSINSSSATDYAGNTASASSISTNTTIDNTPPTVSIGDATNPANANGNQSTSFTFPVTFSNYDAMDANISIITTSVIIDTEAGVSGCYASSVTGSGSTRNVQITGCAGNGLVKIKISANSAVDNLLNPANESAFSSPVTIDNILPLISVNGPTPSLVNSSGTLVYDISITGGSVATQTTAFINSKLSLSGSGTSDCNKNISNISATGFTVKIFNCTSTGTLVLNLASGIATDLATNNSNGTSAPTANIDNSGPSINISNASPNSIDFTQSTSFIVTFTDAHDLAEFTTTDIQSQGAANNCTMSIELNTANSRKVIFSSCSATGSGSFSIIAGAVHDNLNNNNSSATSGAFTITAPMIGIILEYGFSNLNYLDVSNGTFINSAGIYYANLNEVIQVTGYKATGPFTSYEYAVGNTAKSNNLKNWTNIGTAIKTNLNLGTTLVGHSYYASLKAKYLELVTSATLSDSNVFINYLKDTDLTEGSNSFGQSIAISADGLRMIVGEPASDKTYIYSKAPGVRSSWTYLTSLNNTLGSQFGTSVAAHKIATDNYLYLIGAPNAYTHTQGSTDHYSGTVYVYEENGGSVGSSIQTLSGFDYINENYERQDLDSFGSSIALWESSGNHYLLIGTPGQDCKVIASGSNPNSCNGADQSSNTGAVYVFQINGTALASTQKIWQAAKTAEISFGSSIKSSKSGILVSTNSATGNIYYTANLANASLIAASGANNTNIQSMMDLAESETASRPYLAYLDSSGTLTLKKFDGVNFTNSKIDSSNGWNSVSVFSDLDQSIVDHQGAVLLLTSASQSRIGTIDFTLTNGYQNKQEALFGGSNNIIDGSYFVIGNTSTSVLFSFH